MTTPTSEPHEPDREAARGLFDSARELDPGERDAFVWAKASSREQAETVLQLLSTADVDASLQATGANRLTEPSDRVQSTATGELLNKLETAPKLDHHRFELEHEVGRGGMGAVLRIHDRFLNRRLAMKVLLDRAEPRDDEERRQKNQLLGRFIEEAQVTSQLDHPGVVPVHELGLDQCGKVYFTMRLVKGRTAGEIFSDAQAEENNWTVSRALEVILKICDTMAYAHDKGVLHRDLKPSNVMVGRFGEVYVMDWGLAKVVGQEDRRDLRIQADACTGVSRIESARRQDAESDTASSVVTMDGHALGTPSYMSPEQARGEELDTRADVYAIGAILYELLSGRAPYTVPELSAQPYHILAEVLDGPPKRLEELRPQLPGELVAIVDKAMARNREDRYSGTVDIGNDIRAYLANRVVRAYKTGPIAELSMWLRRNRALTVALAGLVATLILGVVVATSFAIHAQDQANEAARSATDARVERNNAQSLAEDRRELLSQSSWSAFNQAARRIAAMPSEPVNLAQESEAEALLQLAKAVELDASNGVAWERFAIEATLRANHMSMRFSDLNLGSLDRTLAMSVSPDGMRLATASVSRVKDSEAHEPCVMTWLDREKGLRAQMELIDWPTGIRVAPVGHFIAILGPAYIDLWNSKTGAVTRVLESKSPRLHAIFSPNGESLFCTEEVSKNTGQITKIDVTAATAIATSNQIVGLSIPCCIGSDGSFLLAFGDNCWCLVSTGDLKRQVLSPWISRGRRPKRNAELARGSLSPDHSHIALVAPRSASVEIVRIDPFMVEHSIEAHASIEWLDYSPDGSRLAVASSRHVSIYDPYSTRLVFQWTVDSSPVDAQWSRDGCSLAVLHRSGTVRIWDVEHGTLVDELLHRQRADTIHFDDRNRLLLVTGRGARSSLDPTVSRAFAREWRPSPAPWIEINTSQRLHSVELQNDGERALTVSGTTTAVLWSAIDGKFLKAFESQDGVTAARLTQSGRKVITVTKRDEDMLRTSTNEYLRNGGLVKIWEVDRPDPPMILDHGSQVAEIKVFDDETRLVTLGSGDGVARIWDMATGQPVGDMALGEGCSDFIALPDGRIVIVRGTNVEIRSQAQAETFLTLPHASVVSATAIDEGGSRLATGLVDGRIAVWDTVSGEQVGSASLGSRVSSIVLDHGRHIMACGGADFVALVDPQNGKESHRIAIPGGSLELTLSSDSTRLLARGATTTSLWDVATGKQLVGVARNCKVVAAELGPLGRRLLVGWEDGIVRLLDLGFAQDLRRDHTESAISSVLQTAQALTKRSLTARGDLSHQLQVARFDVGTPPEYSPLWNWLKGNDDHVGPGNELTMSQRADAVFALGPNWLSQLVAHDPHYPLLALAIAEGGSPAALRASAPARERRMEYLRNLGIANLPNDARTCSVAARMLFKQGDKPRALVAARAALALDPTSELAMWVRDESLK